MVLPRMAYISDATELGTVYTKAELTALRAACDAHGMYLYLDGARLAQALTAAGSDLQPEDLPRLCDAFYIGGTKNGLLFGEAMVIVNDALKPGFRRAMTLGEVLKRRRTECKMTQEFVAEALGVSRQAVSSAGERRIRSKHGEPHCACKALRHNAGGASERKSVTAEERPSIRLCRMVDALFLFMRQYSFLCAFRACKTG